MVVDTSAILAVVLGEPDADWFRDRLIEPVPCRVSAVTTVEARIVAEARVGGEGLRELEHLLTVIDASTEPVDAEQARLAFAGWQRYGKGRHPAGLNLGDCFSYALARSTGEPLLFKGTDFSQTDLSVVT
jgi:ribonuclease VapC